MTGIGATALLAFSEKYFTIARIKKGRRKLLSHAE